MTTTLRQLREQAGLSLNKFARLCDVAEPSAWQWEHCLNAPRAYRRPRIAAVLGVTEDELNKAIDQTMKKESSYAVAD
jgi:transcriptional regulator with XRE-family HTH domain